MIAVDTPAQTSLVVTHPIQHYKLKQNPSEFSWLLDIALDLRPRTIVEIGTNTEESIWALGHDSAFGLGVERTVAWICAWSTCGSASHSPRTLRYMYP